MDIMRQSACLAVNQITVYSSLHDGGSGIRLNEGTDVKLWLGPPRLNLRFSFALTICESWAIFFVSS